MSITTEWLIHERLRYETLTAPDVDNTLKVVLDSLCGPEGVLINDCQVQHVSCHWIDWTRSDQQLTVTVRHSPDDWISKQGLVFVEVARRLCWPVSLDWPPKALALVLEHLDRATSANERILELMDDWGLAQRVLPLQQPYHRGRLRGFTVMSVNEVRDALALKQES